MYVPVWFPGAGFQRWAKNAKEQFFKMTRTPFNQVKRQMVTISWRVYNKNAHFLLVQVQGVATSSFVSSSLESLGDDLGTKEDQDVLMSTAGSLFSGMFTCFPFLIQLEYVQSQSSAGTETVSHFLNQNNPPQKKLFFQS